MHVRYSHWSSVPSVEWPYLFFKPVELASKGDGSLLANHPAIQKLEALRRLLGKPVIINSAYRDPIHNARVGGAPMSRHKKGDAFDIALKSQSKQQLIQFAKQAGFTGFGINYRSFVHVDCGPERSW